MAFESPRRLADNTMLITFPRPTHNSASRNDTTSFNQANEKTTTASRKAGKAKSSEKAFFRSNQPQACSLVPQLNMFPTYMASVSMTEDLLRTQKKLKAEKSEEIKSLIE